MPSRAIEESIITISSIIAITVLAAAIFSGLSKMKSSYIAAVTVNSELIKTDITVIFATNSSSTVVKVWVKNTGSSRIPLDAVKLSDLFFGSAGNISRIEYGTTPPCWSYEILNGNSNNYWENGETLEITIRLTEVLTEGDYQVIFVLYNGAKSEYWFSI